MKTKLLLFLPISVILVFIYGFGGGAKWPGGSPGGYTGSPGDGKDCTNCHGGSASQVLGWISSDIPDDGYIPGETYTIFISVSGSGDKGFEVSPQNPEGNLLGTLHDGSGVHLVAGNTAVTQDDATSANPASWQFDWTAPAAGTGAVTFYGAFTVNKPVTKLCTYVVQENTGIYISEASILECSVYPNPASEMIRLSLNVPIAGKLNIWLISMNGQVHEIYDSPAYHSGQLDMQLQIPDNITSGTYILQTQLGSLTSNTTLIIN